jgi:hypothetical protein
MNSIIVEAAFRELSKGKSLKGSTALKVGEERVVEDDKGVDQPEAMVAV